MNILSTIRGITQTKYNRDMVCDRPKYCEYCGDKLEFDLKFIDDKYDRKTGELVSVTPVRQYRCINHQRYIYTENEHDFIEWVQSPIKDKRVFMMLFPHMYEEEEQ